MKYKVTYYDYDTDSTITKNCIDIDYNTVDKTFSFYPVDDPPRIYKSVVIDHPKVSIHQNKDKLSISVEGYQYIKEGGCWRTTTTIENVRED